MQWRCKLAERFVTSGQTALVTLETSEAVPRGVATAVGDGWAAEGMRERMLVVGGEWAGGVAAAWEVFEEAAGAETAWTAVVAATPPRSGPP